MANEQFLFIPLERRLCEDLDCKNVKSSVYLILNPRKTTLEDLIQLLNEAY